MRLWNFNARFKILEENDWDQAWLPAVTAGVTYKYNEDFKDLDSDMRAVNPGGLDAIAGLKDELGWDAHIFASKMLMIEEIPFVFTLGGRYTDSAQIGLLGFTDDYSFNVEAAACSMITSDIVLAAEYR